MNKDELKGWLLAYCDSIDELVKRKQLQENDLAVKSAKYIREYLELLEDEFWTCCVCGAKVKVGYYHCCQSLNNNWLNCGSTGQ